MRCRSGPGQAIDAMAQGSRPPQSLVGIRRGLRRRAALRRHRPRFSPRRRGAGRRRSRAVEPLLHGLTPQGVQPPSPSRRLAAGREVATGPLSMRGRRLSPSPAVTRSIADRPFIGRSHAMQPERDRDAVRDAVKELLDRSPAFRSLPPERQREVASNTAAVASAMAEAEGATVREVDFPAFVRRSRPRRLRSDRRRLHPADGSLRRDGRRRRAIRRSLPRRERLRPTTPAPGSTRPCRASTAPERRPPPWLSTPPAAASPSNGSSSWRRWC